MTESWNPALYSRFSDERTRPAVDLISRIQIEPPRSVVDLGCGPGNSTSVLRERWPQARMVGVDNSREMIEAARVAYPAGEWVLADVEHWEPDGLLDLVSSNATLQWLHDHASLVVRLFGWVAPGGALAFQVPSADFAAVRALTHEVAGDSIWVERMTGALTALTMESAAFYYAYLAPIARSLDIWETEYLHILPSRASIVEWISHTLLLPFLNALDSEKERGAFVRKLEERVEETYEANCDGSVLFPFRRLFVVAYA